MTRIEDLLRQTLVETPISTTTPDPVGALDGRIRRARHRVALGAGLGVVALAAAIVVPLTQLDHGNGKGAQVFTPPTPTPSVTTPAEQADVWINGGARGVATNDARGHSFVVTSDENDKRFLTELSLRGAVLHRFPVADPSLFVKQREGLAWVWGGGDGGYPTPTVTAVGLNNGASASIDLDQYGAVNDLAITEGGSAWAVTAENVLQLKFSGDKVTVAAVIPLPGGVRIGVTAGGDLWVQADKRFVKLVPQGGPEGVGAQKQDSEHWDGLLLNDGVSAIWSTDDPRRAVELDPSALSAGTSVALVGKRLQLHGRPWVLVDDGNGGVYVALFNGDIEYFAPGNDTGPADEILPSVDVETMSISLDGGVVFTTTGGDLDHWLPSSLASR